MIRLRDVTKVHRRGETEVPALRGVSCELAQGSFTVIVGPSGSGKSTLLYLIGALDEPTSGEIVVEDRRVSEFTERERNAYRRDRVGFVFQNFNLLKNLTAVENVLVPYLPRGLSAEMRGRANDLLALVGLADRRDHRPSQLSGGEQQRVALARALLKQPAMVLADEPTGELDTQSGAEVVGYLRNHHEQRGTTVIVVSHDDRYIAPGDGVLKLRDGLLDA